VAAEYQESDWRVADYEPYCLDAAIIDRSTKRPLHVRGPRPQHLEKGGYLVCLGAAQTFGRFCQRPFPAILQERLRIPVLNISHGGAGPAFFCGDNERLLAYLNDACGVVVQVMSGRSDSSSLFESEGVGYFRRRAEGTYVGCDEAFSELIGTQPWAYCEQIVEETRRSWCESYRTLLSGIEVPKVLFWFATRTPFYRQGWRSLAQLFGDFPQLVNPEMVAEVRRHCDHYVECVTRRGLPQTLVDLHTGAPTTVSDPWTSQPWTRNWYYPSAEMHEEAATRLEPACRTMSGARAMAVAGLR
jgi:hypothetical protein